MIRFDFISAGLGRSDYRAHINGRDAGRIMVDSDGAVSSMSINVTAEIVTEFNRHVAELYGAARAKYPDAFPTTPLHRVKGGAA